MLQGKMQDDHQKWHARHFKWDVGQVKWDVRLVKWDKAFETCQEIRDKASSTCLMEHVKWDKESGIWDRIQSRNRKIGC